MSKTNQLKVTGLPQDVTEDQLKFRFENKRRGGGGPVREVKLNKTKTSAIIVFTDCDAVDRIWKNGPTISINGKNVILKRVDLAMQGKQLGRESPEPRSSSASSMKSVKSDKSGSRSTSASAKSLQKTKSDLDTGTQRERERNRNASASSDSSESNHRQNVASSELGTIQDIARRTIKATVRDITKSKDSFFNYLDDPEVNEGKFDKRSMLLDGLRRHLFVTFCDERDARTFCHIHHGEESNFVSVEIATEVDVSFYRNIISVHSHNVGFDYGRAQEKLRTFVTERTGQRVVDITQYDEPRSVLLEFVPEKCAGKLGEIGWRISGEPFQGEKLITAPVYRNNKVIISGLKHTTTEDTLVRFLSHSDSGGEQGAVVNSVEWLGLQAVVELKSGKCVRNILGKAPHWLEDKEIRIQRFHPCLTAETYDDYMGRPLPQPTTKGTPAPIQSTLDAEQMTMKTVIPRPDRDNEDKIRGTMDVDINDDDDDDDDDQDDVRKEQNNEMEVEGGDGNEDKKTSNERESKKRPAKQLLDLEENEFEMLKETKFIRHLEEMHKVAIRGDTDEGFYVAGQDKHRVNEAVIEILKKVREFKMWPLRDLDKDQVELLQNPEIQMRIKKKLLRKEVTAHFQYDGNEFSITCHPAEDRHVVEEMIIHQVEKKKIALDDNETFDVFQSAKGKEFLVNLSAGNDNRPPAVVKLSHKDHSIMLVSSKKHIYELLEQIKTFTEKNKICGKMIPVSGGKQEFIAKFEKSHYEQMIESLKNTATTVSCRPAEDIIEVKGPSEGIDDVKAKLLPLYEEVATLTSSLEYFGIKEFLEREAGKELVEKIEERHKCVIKEKLSNNQSYGESAEGPATEIASGDKLATIASMSVDGCNIVFKQGSLLDIKADVIVNAVDESLKFKTTISRMMAQKGGQSIEAQLGRSHFAKAGEIIPTSAGDLQNCKIIFHIVCPIFSGSSRTDVETLTSGISQCLDRAVQQGFTTIAFPTIGVGKIFKFPELAAGRALIKSLQSHLEKGRTSLKQIFVCDMQASNLKMLMERCESVFTNFELEKLQEPTEDKVWGEGAKPKQPAARSSHGGKGFGHISVKVESGEITKQKTDVIVSVTEKSLSLYKGKMGKTVLEHGGDSIQKELSSRYSHGIYPGNFVETASGKLKCKHIFHACVPHYEQGKEDQLTRLVLKMLEAAEDKHAKSISIPALGTGYLKYPADVSAHTILDAISQFATKHPQSNLRSVQLVVFSGGKDDILKLFKAGLNLASEGGRGASSAGAHGMETTMNFGSVKLTVKKGDITEEKCHVIVNAIKEDMDLSSSGAVGKSLRKKGGALLEMECKRKASEIKENGIAETSGDLLKCDRIIHLSTEKFGHIWDIGLVKAFEMADRNGMKSLAFPVFGAGKKSADLQHIKEMIITAVQTFGNSGAHTLKDLRVVIFNQELMDAFLEERHQTEPSHGGRVSRQSSHRGRLSRQSSYSEHGAAAAAATPSAPKMSERTEVTIFGKNQESCRRAEEALQKELDGKVVTGEEEDSTFKQFNQNQINDLKEFGQKNHILISVNTREGIITFKGFPQQDTMSALQRKLRDLVKGAVEEHHNIIHKAIPLAIQWQYKGKHGKWKNFEPLLNSMIEIEYGKKSKFFEIADSQERKYHVDLKAMVEHELDDNGKPTGQSFEIQRKDRTKEEPLPDKWDSMHGTNLKLVAVTPGSHEYQNVAKRFQGGGSVAPIKKIERIQNKALYQQYAVKKREIESRNPKKYKNERKLFHGTNAKGVRAICENGFNRNYSGKNAAMYGDGVYFAVDSSYATAYAEADNYGQSQIFVARVLVGESVTTDSGTRYLPNKPNSQFTYDSGTDGSDKIYVIFHDAQAYPEYLITF